MTVNKHLAELNAMSARAEHAAVVGWIARAKALRLDADAAAEMGAPSRAVDILAKAVNTDSLANVGAVYSVMAFIENASRASAFMAMVNDRAFRRAPFDTPLVHSGTMPIPSGHVEGALIPVAELELEGATLKSQSVGTIIVASEEAWNRIDAPGQAYINGLLQTAMGKAVDVRMFEALAGTTPVAFTADRSDQAATVTALRSALAAMLTKAGQTLRWALSPTAAAVLATISADGLISVGPNGGTMFQIPAYITDGLAEGEVALIVASDIAADVIDLGITRSKAATLQLPGGELISMFQCNLLAVRGVLTFGVLPLADTVMAKVTLTE